jgi:RNA polymerase sigma-70 factor (ECF subfamily)
MTEEQREKYLLERLRAGESAALGELIELHRQRLERIVRLRFDARLAARISPEDVLQETYLDAARQIHRYLENPRASFYIWIRGLALERLFNLARDNLKARRRAAGLEIRLPEGSSALLGMRLVAAGTSPSQHLSRKELHERVRLAVARLDETDREVILMRHFENLSNGEVAEALGLTDSGATMRYGRALCRLKEVWRQELGSEESTR